MAIHQTAIIDPSAEIDPSVEIGAYAIIEGPCKIGAGTKIYPHAVICKWTEMGEENQIHYAAVIGQEPQHVAYKGEERWTRIGNRNVIREQATVHRGFESDEGTIIGDECFIMGLAHVGHDCRVENEVVIVNNCLLGGHVEVEEGAFLGGGAAFHQRVRVGSRAMVGGLSAVHNDIPPYLTVNGVPARIQGINRVGLKRAGFTTESRKAIKDVFTLIYRRGLPIGKAIEQAKSNGLCDATRHFVEFIENSKRGVCRMARRDQAANGEQ